MKILRYSTQYKKDFKRYRNNPSKLAKLLEVFRMLQNEIELPPEYKAHMLKGDYKDCMDRDIKGDFLLIWLDLDTDVIDELMPGSHSALFKKYLIIIGSFARIHISLYVYLLKTKPPFC